MYKEGSLFSLPLENGFYAVGLLARGQARKKDSVLFGYFFDFVKATEPSEKDSLQVLWIETKKEKIKGWLLPKKNKENTCISISN